MYRICAMLDIRDDGNTFSLTMSGECDQSRDVLRAMVDYIHIEVTMCETLEYGMRTAEKPR